MTMVAKIENAIIAAIGPGINGWVPVFCGSYGGEFDDEIEHVVRKFPGVWVAHGGSKFERANTTRTKFKVAGMFAVMLGVRNIRGEAATRHGTKDTDSKIIEVGTYQMLSDVRRILTGEKFGLDIDPIEPTATRTLFNTTLNKEALSVMALELKINWVEDFSAKPAEDEALMRLHISYQNGIEVLATDVIQRP